MTVKNFFFFFNDKNIMTYFVEVTFFCCKALILIINLKYYTVNWPNQNDVIFLKKSFTNLETKT